MKDLNILIVEDEAIVKLHLAKALRIFYKNVFEANNGYEAREIIKTNKIDVVITDINMPKINGFGSGSDLIDYLISIKHIKVMPIVIVSAYNDICCKYKEIECLEVINKPINSIEKITNAIDKVYEEKEKNLCTDEVFYRLKEVNKKIEYILKELNA